jgi:hypothetical protein
MDRGAGVPRRAGLSLGAYFRPKLIGRAGVLRELLESAMPALREALAAVVSGGDREG